MDNNQRGTYAEYLFATECLKRGYNVSFPLLDSSLYDCIIDTGFDMLRVQIKSTNKKPFKKTFNNVQVTLANNKSTYTKDKIDYFAVWCDFYV